MAKKDGADDLTGSDSRIPRPTLFGSIAFSTFVMLGVALATIVYFVMQSLGAAMVASVGLGAIIFILYATAALVVVYSLAPR